MVSAVFHLLLAVPAVTVLAAVLATWLLRRRPGRLRPAWLLGFGALLVAADAEPLPLPDPTAGGVWGSSTPRRHTLELGLGGGSYQTCAGVRRHGDLGAMYEYSTPITEHVDLNVRAGGFGVWDADTVTGGGRGSVGVEHRWVGARIGGIVGAIGRDGASASFAPAASLRIGPRDVFFVDAQLLDVAPAPLPGPFASVGVGAAFPRLGNAWQPLVVRAGVAGDGVYLAPSLPVGEQANVELRGAYGDSGTWGASASVRLHFADE